MKIKYIDSYCTNGIHLIFNATLLAVLYKISQKLEYYGKSNSRKQIFELLKENRQEINLQKQENLLLPNINSGFTSFLSLFLGFFYNTYFVISSSKSDILVFNYNNLFSIHWINFLNNIFKKKIVVFCHGELEFIINPISKYGILNKLQAIFAKKFFLNKNIKIHKDTKFFVLGDSVLNNVKKKIPENILSNFFPIDHPYFFKKHEAKNSLNKKINIGTVGVFSKLKGADEFCLIHDMVNKDKFLFSITGKIFYDISKLENMKINLPKNNGENFLSFEELNQRVESLDVILYLYPKDSYKLTASGAILDAINMRKPIIALKNDYFCYMFEKFGHFGYLFDSIEEIAYFLNNINKDNIGSFDFDSIQKKLSVENIANDLKEKLQDIGWL